MIIEEVIIQGLLEINDDEEQGSMLQIIFLPVTESELEKYFYEDRKVAVSYE
jgi:hypothetical protein